MADFEGFSPELFKFLKQLEKNNNRDWFQENKSRYEQYFLGGALGFIEAMAGPLKSVSPHFTAIPKRSGGSLMRIYRDTRFSKNKTPYKTNVGIQFRHEVGKDVHAPGFYFHIDAKQVFLGAGVWHPDNGALNSIREAIDEQQSRWKRIINSKSIKNGFERHGDSLKRPPRGFDAEHPFIEDLKLKDHFVLVRIEQDDLYSKKIVNIAAKQMKSTKPYMQFLCEALRLPC